MFFFLCFHTSQIKDFFAIFINQRILLSIKNLYFFEKLIMLYLIFQIKDKKKHYKLLNSENFDFFNIIKIINPIIYQLIG